MYHCSLVCIDHTNVYITSSCNYNTDCGILSNGQDGSADYSTCNSVGMKNVLRCSIVSGIYETLLEYAFVAGDKR